MATSLVAVPILGLFVSLDEIYHFLLAFFSRANGAELSINLPRNSFLILLPGKFQLFDWLRPEAFQLHLKYLNVKITVTMVTPNHQIISSHELRKNGGNISRFKIRRFKKTKILRKVHRPGSMSGPAGLKTRTSKPICSPTKQNNSTKINTFYIA